MRTIQRLTPAVTPVAVETAKAHLRVVHHEDDSAIRMLVEAATEWLETTLGRPILQSNWVEKLDCFPTLDVFIELAKSPLVSVTSVVYRDEDDAEQTLATSKYHVVLDDYRPGRIELAHDESWPATYHRPDAVTITYTAGWANVPPQARQIILLLVGHWYENREAVTVGTITKEIELAVASLARTLKTGFVAGA